MRPFDDISMAVRRAGNPNELQSCYGNAKFVLGTYESGDAVNYRIYRIRFHRNYIWYYQLCRRRYGLMPGLFLELRDFLNESTRN